jgi:sugar phosphate isomerase/epimerase
MEKDPNMKVGTLLHPTWLAESLLNPSTQVILTPLIERCAAAGASHVELTGEIFTLAPPSLLDRIEQEIQCQLVPYKRERGISFSLHLPNMGGLDLSSSIEEIRRATLQTYKRIAEIVHPLQPESYVLHIAGFFQEAVGVTFTADALSSLGDMALRNARQSLKELSGFLEPETICLENLPTYSMELLSPVIQECDVSVCLDIGHLTTRGDPLEGFLENFKERIREVHLHDVKRVRHGPFVSVQVDHQALGQGALPLQRILSALSACGFSGPLVLETLHDTGISSIPRLKTMLQELENASK